MTITSNILRRDYTANGVNTTFAFDFPIFYETNSTPKFSLEVIITDLAGAETTKIETTDYTITYNTTDYVNGVINQGNVVLNTAPILNYKVSILRKLNFTQNTDITTSGSDALPGTALEGSLDKLTLINLEIKENLNRVVRLPKSSSLTNIEFPIGSSQANQLIAINNDGTNLTTKDLADVGLAPVSTYIKTLLDDTTALQARTTLDAQQLNANLTALAGLTGASNKLFYFTGSGAMALQDRLATTTTQGVSYLNNPITIANNTTTPNTDIDFSGGVFNFSDGTGQAIALALTKRLQSTGSWSAGAGGNLLLSGARANSSTYHLYAMAKADGTTDYGGLLGVANTDPNPTSVLPSGYIKFDRIGSILTDGSGNIRAFIQNERLFSLTNPLISQNLTLSTNTRGSYALDVPVGIKVLANIYGSVSKNSSGSSQTYISDLATTDIDPIGSSGFYTMVCNIAYSSNDEIWRMTNKSSQIGIRCNNSTSSTNVIIMTLGWYDSLLKY